VKSVDPESGASPAATESIPSSATAPTQVDVPIAHPQARAASDTDLIAVGTAIARYLVIGRLGAGGMGVVYTAFDPELDRKVAIKLLKDVRSQAAQHRLLREAQALARLSHPNVVAVHDTGTHDGHVFIALELVDGSTLKEWLAAGERSWQEIVGACLAAGRGLAAAHKKDIIHRDFTPNNVLIGRDGRIAVTDFGLARPTSYPAARAPADLAVDDLSSGGSTELDTPLTKTGSVVGTPGYIAPEQYLGGSIDARSDIYSFAVTLYEALYGQRPFRGKGDELRAAVLRGTVAPPPRTSRVPRRIHQALERALAVDPAQRPASMDALIAELERDPAATRRRMLLAGGIVAALCAAFAGFWLMTRGEDTTCRGLERPLDGVWDAGRRRAVASAFAATGVPFARQALKSVETSIDRHAARWAGMRRDACEATRVRGEQSEAVLSLRMQCLDRRLAELSALVHLLAGADKAVVTGSVDAAAALRDLSSCADVEALLAPVPLPDAPEVRARGRALEVRLAEVKAMLDAGRYKDALARAGAALAEARQLGHRPLIAEAMELDGVARDRTGDLEGAVTALSDAVWTGTAARHDEVAARAATRLTYVVGYEQAKVDRGLEWARQAEAVLERTGRTDDLAYADMLMEKGRATYKANGYQAALELFGRARALRARLLGEEHHLVAQSMNSMGVVLKELGRFDEAQATLARSLAISTATLGESHPVTSKAMANLGLLLDGQGRDAEAEKYQRRALAAREAALGPDHLEVSFVLGNLSSVLLDLGRTDEALAAARRGLAIREKQTGADSEHTADGLSYVAQAQRAQGKLGEAAETNRRSLAILEKKGAGRDPNIGVLLSRLAEISEEQGRWAEALAYYRRVKENYEAALGPDHPDLADPLTGMARAELELGGADRVIAPLEDALKRRLSVAASIDPILVADTRFALARALWKSGRDRPRARALAGEALAGLATGGTERTAAMKTAIETWLSRPR
jgi:tetratricopeptide (TPR) repeat protein